MIAVFKNKQGYVFAYCEWTLVDSGGNPRESGKYLYIRELWIHKDYRIKRVMDVMIRKIRHQLIMKEKEPQVDYVYWHRSKYNRLSKIMMADKFRHKLQEA